LRFFASVEGAQIRMASAAWHAAVATVGEREGTQGVTVVGAIDGHGFSRKKIRFGIFGEVSRRRTTLQGKSTKSVITGSTTIAGDVVNQLTPS
jgi:hypothetical protein